MKWRRSSPICDALEAMAVLLMYMKAVKRGRPMATLAALGMVCWIGTDSWILK